ncbi:phosphoadenylylsulfate reductase (thioredoxin) [Scopulibacillus darangshiensis]|uniref:Adenosine 5'-phosphosulfate reductase n=1 Tax=Scopulibacillus darangshiensis TaxID=442528 RepID=A0A4R2NQ29_9BACL|nr:phosphoadenylyl-sulfate reductase [Scopulibacillus darangshiensis]TCP23464.1 phosphoadenylylsulfate reductase (thioredoxin) [Scopulibacillus darangshiensis]
MSNVTYDGWDEKQLDVPVEGDLKGSRHVLDWAYKTYGDDIIYACSFGAEGIVLIDLISQIESRAEIVFLDTDFHFKETYELINKVKEKYPSLKINMQKPELTPSQQADQYGSELWKTNPNLCCNIRKIEPLKRSLSGKKAWISGLRRDQSSTRKDVEFINKDNKFELMKICPLIHWTWDDVWQYIRENDLPYNSLHDHGYPSIGCEYCTSQVEGHKDSRAGRWANLEKTECGLHWD